MEAHIFEHRRSKAINMCKHPESTILMEQVDGERPFSEKLVDIYEIIYIVCIMQSCLP